MSNDFPVDKCIVCNKRKQYGRVLQFFKFPYDIERCKSWVRVIGMRELLFMPLQKLREQLVCAAHFDTSDIVSNRLRRLAVPSLTPYPTLSDEDIKDFPKNRNMATTESNKFNDRHRRDKKDETSSLADLEPVIDYERPLMESLETLVHNERHVVKKPAGILNSIAVPLMSYSSSLEKGTVFAAADPVSTFNLPFVPFIEPSSQNDCKPRKRFNNVKALPDLRKTKVNTPAAPIPEPPAKEIKITEQNNTLIGKVIPTVKPVEIQRMVKAQNLRNSNISFGMHTLITGNSRNANKINSANKTPEQRYKNIKQYTRNRLNANSTNKNISIKNKIISIGATDQPQTDLIPKVDSVLHESSSSANLVPTNSIASDANDSATIETGSPKPGASCELTFVPYSKYVTTVPPESLNAHTAEGTLDYGLPLMNCIGTVFQGNIHTSIKTETEDDAEVIDIPLMKCLKTLQHSND